MLDNRKNRRYRTLAHVRILGVLNNENLLKDLSITGCCVECTACADIKLDTQYQLEIHPESVANVGSFELTVRTRWIRFGEYTGEVGFVIVASPKGKLFQRYVDYLGYRSSLA
jgi:hypothetical protein